MGFTNTNFTKLNELSKHNEGIGSKTNLYANHCGEISITWQILFTSKDDFQFVQRTLESLFMLYVRRHKM